ncbi:hypothetical protein PWT90_01360 [Aphanocladium album]|nr:hypothetical protein PWT90_01360 [Aphanocladium album]
MVNRKQDQGNSAIEEIKKNTVGADFLWKQCDLVNLAEVRSVSSGIRESLERLDYLVLSAGINANQHGLDDDGIGCIFGFNYLGKYYVVNQLWSTLRKTSLMPGATPPRVVAVSSGLHQGAPLAVKFASLKDINNPNLILWNFMGGEYCHARAVEDAYPGITGQLITYAMKAISRDPEQGSYSTLSALTAPEVEEKQRNGAYLSDPDKLGDESLQANDKGLATEPWELSEELIRSELGENLLESWRNTGVY